MVIPALLDLDVVAAPSDATEQSGETSYEMKDARDAVAEIDPPSLVSVLVSSSGHGAGPSSDSVVISAEEEGFEPTVPLRVRRFSKPVP